MPRPGYATVTPYLVCKNASEAIDWYKKHLGAQERFRLPMPDGSIAHAEIQIGDSVLMISDEMEALGILSPHSLGGSPISLLTYVDNVDLAFAAMIEDGSEQLFEVTDQFHGDRVGKLKDPFGHIWQVATNKVPMQPDEIISAFNS